MEYLLVKNGGAVEDSLWDGCGTVQGLGSLGLTKQKLQRCSCSLQTHHDTKF